MFGELNQKIVGAFVIGIALVAGAYTTANFGKQTHSLVQTSAKAPARVAVAIEDKDGNGIEDWRDVFTPAKVVLLDEAASSTYTLPTTLTGRMSIDLLQNIVRAKNAGPFGGTREEVIANSVEAIVQETSDKIFDVKDISIIDQWTDEDIKNYANTMAGIVINTNVRPKNNEIDILDDIVTRGNIARKGELKEIADGYFSILNKSLAVPVPALFVKQHLDLINTYNAVGRDVAGMLLTEEDPTVALVRLKRYSEDASGLYLAMQNMNSSLKPYSRLFSQSDPAIFFSEFNPDNQAQ